MSARVWPVDAVSGGPSYTGRALRQTSVSPLVGGASTGRPLGAWSGVRQGTPSTIVAATSTTWTVTPFAGLLDGEAAAIAGAYLYAFDTNQTGSVTAAGASARVDRLDVQVDDPAESDGSSVPTIRVLYTVGTPTLAAAPARSHPLARINVPISGGGSPTVSWTAPFMFASGGTATVRSSADMTALGTAVGYDGLYADRTDVDCLFRYNGSAWSAVSNSPWVAYTPTLANLTIGTGGAALTFAESRYEGEMVHVHFTYTIGTTGPAVGTIPTMTLPVTSKTETAPIKFWGTLTCYDVSAPQSYEGRISAVSGSQTTARLLAFPSSAGVPQPITATAPFTWAPGDTLDGDFWYRPASI